tara:strand:- start:2364 stop:3005 length:642 start_codon:yes stop_codon:yes gene_type:complete
MQILKLSNAQIETKNHEVKHNDKVNIISVGGIAVQSDTSPSPTVDGDNRDGWLFTKEASDSSKFNYYIFGSSGCSHPFTFADLKSVHMCCSVDSWANTASVPFINVYSKPTGSGDAAAWYHSRKDYAINISNQKICVGEHINLYAGDRPELKNDSRSIPLESITNNGECLDSEEILFIVVASDSGSAMGTKILLSEAGYNLGNEIKRNIKFVA